MVSQNHRGRNVQPLRNIESWMLAENQWIMMFNFHKLLDCKTYGNHSMKTDQNFQIWTSLLYGWVQAETAYNTFILPKGLVSFILPKAEADLWMNQTGTEFPEFSESHHSQEHMPSLQSWCVGTLYLEITKLYRTSLIRHACLSSRDHPTITKALIYLVILRYCCFPVLQAGIIDLFFPIHFSSLGESTVELAH